MNPEHAPDQDTPTTAQPPGGRITPYPADHESRTTKSGQGQPARLMPPTRIPLRRQRQGPYTPWLIAVVVLASIGVLGVIALNIFPLLFPQIFYPYPVGFPVAR